MKKLFLLFIILVLCLVTLTGCSKPILGDKISIVCTTFPQYDWVKNIVGDKSDSFDITLLMSNIIDLHSYQPTIADIAKISRCDLFIYNGGESDLWIEGVLKEAVNDRMVVINLVELLGDKMKEEEITDGMEVVDIDISYDEHIWLSLKNAAILTRELSEAVIKTDSINEESYIDNRDKYIAELTALDVEYRKLIDIVGTKTLIFGDRFPFRYLLDDYGISYYAAFNGCSSETEASFKTIIFLAKKMDELGIDKIMVTESSNMKIAKAIADNTKNKGISILVLNSMQSISFQEVEKGVSYLNLMKDNLRVIIEALE